MLAAIALALCTVIPVQAEARAAWRGWAACRRRGSPSAR
ncbi:MAG: hypothetical protein WDN04_20750 [Rhodospirillales bacterium]